MQKIEATSRVAKLLSIWVSAIDKFAVVYKIVEPKMLKARNAENDLKEVMINHFLADQFISNRKFCYSFIKNMAALKQKQSNLAEAEADIQTLRDNIDFMQRNFKVIGFTMALMRTSYTSNGEITRFFGLVCCTAKYSVHFRNFKHSHFVNTTPLDR